MSLEQRLGSALQQLRFQSQVPTILGRGKFNVIYTVFDGEHRRALRLNNVNDDPAFTEADRACEYAAHRWAADCKVAPQIFEANIEYLLMEYLPLVHPVKAQLLNSAVLSQIVHAARQVHRGPLPERTKSLWTRATYWMERRRKEARVTAELEQAWTEMERNHWRQGVESKTKLVLGHGDLNPGNIGLLPDRAMLIDFETAAAMTPFFDLSRLCYLAESETVDEMVLKLYFGNVLPEHKSELQISLGLQAFIAAAFGRVSEADQSFEIDQVGLDRFWTYAATIR